MFRTLHEYYKSIYGITGDDDYLRVDTMFRLAAIRYFSRDEWKTNPPHMAMRDPHEVAKMVDEFMLFIEADL